MQQPPRDDPDQRGDDQEAGDVDDDPCVHPSFILSSRRGVRLTAMTEAPPILAAGAVVLRKGPEVLLVHRPKYDDWSLPKGKVDPGEHVTAAAVREVAEETGLRVRLGPPLGPQQYDVRNGSTRSKVVQYWAGRPVGDDDVSAYAPNEEIDQVVWVPIDKAKDLLTYDRDRATLIEAVPFHKRTNPLVVLRHGKAVPRKEWGGEERKRPLSEVGASQAQELVPVLDAFGVRRIVSSSSRRCWTTVSPYADTKHLEVDVTTSLSEQDATRRTVERHVARLLDRAEPSVLCTHRPVLPWVYETLGVPNPKLEAGSLLVVHHRHGRVVAVDRQRV
jgi:8-oxo-dGTP pyrophosphatase MutT (NUDIX family)/phosphohistidine phosphatase SixA